jgi:hypothetical protein
MRRRNSTVRHAIALIQENPTTNVIQVLLAFLGGFFCLIPLYLQPISILEETLLRHSLKSVGYKYSAVATLTLVLPLFLDCLADLIFNFRKGKPNSDKPIVNEGFLNNIEKLLFLSGIAILPIVSFLPDNTRNLAYIYICCNKCQTVFVAGAVIISLSRYDNKCWTDRETYLAVICISLGS